MVLDIILAIVIVNVTLSAHVVLGKVFPRVAMGKTSEGLAETRWERL